MVINGDMSQGATSCNSSMDCDSTISDDFIKIFESFQSPPLDNFSALNDDCIRSIFRYLDEFELIAVRQLSSRFVGIVDETLAKRKQEDFLPFLLKEKILYFDLLANRRPIRKLTLSDTERVLKCIGNFVRKIHLDSVSFQPMTAREVIKRTMRLELLFRLIQNYCNMGNLYELVIWNFHMVENMRHFPSVWNSLRTLQILNLDTRESELEDILPHTHNLVRLEIGVMAPDRYRLEVDDDDSMRNNITGNCLLSQPRTIRSLRLTHCKDLSFNNLCRYFEHNPQLERFFYTKHPDNNIGIILYQQISSRLQNLRQLSIDGIGWMDQIHFYNSIISIQNVNSLSYLKRLKKLKFDACGQDITRLLVRLANNESLDELTLLNAYIHERMFIKSMPFAGLKVLRIFFKSIEEIYSKFLVNISRVVHFPDLEVLHLEYMNIDQFKNPIEMNKLERGLLMLLEKTPTVEKLHLHIPALQLNISNYGSLLTLCNHRPMKKKMFVHISRTNMNQSLLQFVKDNYKRHKHLVEFKFSYHDFSSFF